MRTSTAPPACKAAAFPTAARCLEYRVYRVLCRSVQKVDYRRFWVLHAEFVSWTQVLPDMLLIAWLVPGLTCPSQSQVDSLRVPACPGPSLAEVVSFVSWAALGLLSRSEWFRFVWNVQALACVTSRGKPQAGSATTWSSRALWLWRQARAAANQARIATAARKCGATIARRRACHSLLDLAGWLPQPRRPGTGHGVEDCREALTCVRSFPGAQGGAGSNAGQGRRRPDDRRRGDSDPKLFVLGPCILGWGNLREGMIVT